MKNQEYLKMIAAVVCCLLIASSCNDPDDGGLSGDSGVQSISISPLLDVVDGAEDLTSLIYTDQSFVFYAWLTADNTPVAMGDDYRFNGLYWTSNGGATYADTTSEHALFGYVTGSSADADYYKAIKYSHGDGDLIYAFAKTTPQKEAVEMELKHAVAQLSIEFQFDDFTKDGVVNFSIPDLCESAVMNLTTTPAEYDTSSAATMTYERSYTASDDVTSATLTDLLIPQSIASIEVDVYDSVTTITPDVPLELVAGERLHIVINVTKNPFVEVKMGSVSIEPWGSTADVTFSDAIVIE
ncbi:MAG: fimbrillin family protein [Rikenellaceae bacterium]